MKNAIIGITFLIIGAIGQYGIAVIAMLKPLEFNNLTGFYANVARAKAWHIFDLSLGLMIVGMFICLFEVLKPLANLYKRNRN